MSHNTSDSAIGCFIQSICERIDSARSRKLSKDVALLKAPSKLALDYSTESPATFGEDYMLDRLLSKYKGWTGVKIDPKVAAINGWLAVETENEKINRRLKNFMRGTGYPGSDLITVISTAQHHISEILGRFSLSKVLGSCRWGPGATADLPRGTFRDQKMTRCMSTTRAALPYMKILIESDPNWIEAITGVYPDGPVSLMKDFWCVVESSRFTTVPKKWDIERSIDIQPTANGYLQSGVGQYMRKRLLRFGIDLDSQEYNQIAAREGVRRGWATVDLQNASDSIALELCTLLLPWDWMQYLTALRTVSTIGPWSEKPHKLQKISSMGNGFTFELETLVFYALTLAVCELEQLSSDEVLVYGDDIICPNQAYEKLVYVFEYLGFTINQEKSFSTGWFRESCGRHFFRDVEVTPIYQKNLVNSPEEAIRFHNRLVRWSDRMYADPWRFEECLTQVIDYFCFMQGDRLPADRIPRIPLGAVSDDGFLCPISELQLDNNGGCFTTVLRRCKKKPKGKRTESAYLSLKLIASRSPSSDIWYFKGIKYFLDRERSNFNSTRDGRVEEDTGKGRYRISKSYLYDVARFQ